MYSCTLAVHSNTVLYIVDLFIALVIICRIWICLIRHIRLPSSPPRPPPGGGVPSPEPAGTAGAARWQPLHQTLHQQPARCTECFARQMPGRARRGRTRSAAQPCRRSVAIPPGSRSLPGRPYRAPSPPQVDHLAHQVRHGSISTLQLCDDTTDICSVDDDTTHINPKRTHSLRDVLSRWRRGSLNCADFCT